MNKDFFRENIEKIVRLLPRPKMNGIPIAKSRNSWLFVEQYGQEDGIVVLNILTNHEGRIPKDSIREWREPDMIILRAQVNVGKNGLFELSPFLDGHETEMLVEDDEMLPEREAWTQNALKLCTTVEIEVLKQLLIRETLEQGEINAIYFSMGFKNGHEVYTEFASLLSRTSFLDVGERQKVWIKPTFAPILAKLLRSKTNTDTIPQPPQLS